MARMLAVFAVFGGAGLAAAADVYSNWATPLGSYTIVLGAAASDGPEIGNEVVLGPGDRWGTVAQFRLRHFAQGVNQSQMRLRLYANDGAAGAPGTVLWDSGPRSLLGDSGPDLVYTVPLYGGAALTDRLTWTIQITGRSGTPGEIGLPQYGPPTVGSAEPGHWERNGGAWAHVGTEAAMSARIIACYANCNASTVEPVLNVLDFNCFINRFAGGEAYTNCDGSTAAPVLNVLDFNCFLNRFTAGCE